MKTKICKKCGKEYPATREFFYYKPEYKDGLANSCKTCYRFGPRKEKVDVPEGCKLCNKCKNILPATEENFRLKKDKKGKYILYYMCKECEQLTKQQYRASHKEYISQYNAYYRDTHKDYFINYYKAKRAATYKSKINRVYTKPISVEELKEYKPKENKSTEHKPKETTVKQLPKPKYCIECGKQYIPHNKKQKFCSDDCRNQYRNELRRVSEDKDFIDNRTIDMRQVGILTENTKRAVLERDGYKCYICGKKTNLHVHHINPRFNGGEHHIDNLVTLCGGCHKSVESGNLEKAVFKCVQRAIKNRYL